MAKQLNVFIENKPGRVKSVTQTLASEGINIRAFAIQDRGEYGMIKLIVDDPEKAQLILADNNFACKLRDVLAIAVEDKTGNLFRLTCVLADNKVNIHDVFGVVSDSDSRGLFFVETNSPLTDELVAQLAAQGFSVRTDAELYGL